MKKISVDDLRIGMFVHEICGSWMDHPFWASSFVISDRNDLISLQKSSIREVWIDPDKGRDTDPSVPVSAPSPIPSSLMETIKEARATKVATQKTSFEDELVLARGIHARSHGVIHSLLTEARMDIPVDLMAAHQLVEDICNSVLRNSEALISLLHAKTKKTYPYLHAVAVCALMIALGKQMGFDNGLLKRLGMAGLLLDIGKTLLPLPLLNKQARLTDEEFEMMKSHPLLGYHLLQNLGVDDEIILDVCAHHHERMDGKGYPDWLPGEKISIYANMGTCCDVYDAITSERSYQTGWALGQAIRKMAEWQEGQFNRTVFHAFVRTVGLYPSGTLVQLKSGRLAYVVEQHPSSLMTPLVKAFYSTRQNVFIEPLMLDLGKCGDAILNVEDPAKWHFKAAHLL